MRGMRKYIVLLLVGSVAFAALFAYLGYRSFHEAGPMAQETVYILPKGQGVIRTAWQLEQAGLVSSKDIFKLGVQVSGYERRLQAGEYLIPAHTSMQQIMLILASGKVIQHKATIVEGWTSWQIEHYLNSLENLVDPVTIRPPEGSIMPETYLYTHETPRHELIKRMQARQTELLKDLWQGREEGLPFETVEEALILASIVEKETAVASERSHIAGVFVNRLRKRMRLQTDPTVIYGLSSKGFLQRPLSRADLKKTTAYNTYVIRGLPPTPIAHPGRASIEAVLHPLRTEDLYFVADGSGGHSFAVNLRDHTNNVRQYRKLEKLRK